VHYCSKDFVLKKSLFGATEITESTTGENIQSAIAEYVKFIDLDIKKMICVVRDDGSAVKKAASLMQKIRLTFKF
jgi:hypothetical protein